MANYALPPSASASAGEPYGVGEPVRVWTVVVEEQGTRNKEQG